MCPVLYFQYSDDLKKVEIGYYLNLRLRIIELSIAEFSQRFVRNETYGDSLNFFPTEIGFLKQGDMV